MFINIQCNIAFSIHFCAELILWNHQEEQTPDILRDSTVSDGIY